MIKFKNLKSILVTSVLTVGISLITSQSLFAATLTTTYIVKNGDCLSVIAQNHRESLYDLRKANNKWNDLIFPGQALYVFKTNSTVKQSIVKVKAPPIVKRSIVKVKAPIVKRSIIKARPIVKQLVVTARPIVKQLVVTAHPAVMQTKAIAYTASDLNLLSRLISAEARGESYTAQVAVGAVVVNRVKSSYFPKSISAVINQNINGSYQFTPVYSGSINTPALPSDVQAAYAALSGIDPTNNSLFFYSGITPQNLTLPQPIAIKIDDLTFVHLI
jgi:spore germination cell wall hydrolase CwlJ-like protein